jgi:hypothetical protein
MLLRELATHLQKPVETVRREANLVYFDVVPVRAADAGIDDSIPLQASIELYSAVRKLVVASAGATLRRTSQFGRGLPGQARSHSRIVRVGQTQRGSYVVPVISRARFAESTGPSKSPKLEDQHLDIEVEESLFERRALSTMASALDVLHSMASGEREATGADLSDAVDAGVSRELCLGVEKALQSPSISELSLEFQWAAAARPPRTQVAGVSFTDESKEIVGRISDRLRVLDRPREDVLYGLVTELRHRPHDSQPRVAVEALVGRRIRTVYMNLTPEQYEVAQECHDRTKVVVRGQLSAPPGDRAEMEVEHFGPDPSLI